MTVRFLSKFRSRLAVPVVMVALCVLTAPAAADARRPPTKREAAAITLALHKTGAIRRGLCFHVRNIVISTAGPWASAKVIRCGDQHHFDTALAVLQRSRGKWRVRDLGTAEVGCTVAPARVRRDLRLVCSPSFTAVSTGVIGRR